MIYPKRWQWVSSLRRFAGNERRDGAGRAEFIRTALLEGNYIEVRRQRKRYRYRGSRNRRLAEIIVVR